MPSVLLGELGLKLKSDQLLLVMTLFFGKKNRFHYQTSKTPSKGDYTIKGIRPSANPDLQQQTVC